MRRRFFLPIESMGSLEKIVGIFLRWKKLSDISFVLAHLEKDAKKKNHLICTYISDDARTLLEHLRNENVSMQDFCLL